MGAHVGAVFVARFASSRNCANNYPDEVLFISISASSKFRTVTGVSAIAIATGFLGASQALAAAPPPENAVPTPPPPAAPANVEECALDTNATPPEIICAPGTDPDGLSEPYNSISATVQAGSQVQGEIDLLVGANVTIDGDFVSNTGRAVDVGAASTVVNNGFITNTTSPFSGIIRTGNGSTIINNGVISSGQSSLGGIEANSNTTVINNGDIFLSGSGVIGITGTGSVSAFGSDTGTTVINSMTGRIIVGNAVAGIFLGNDATVVNDGLVQTFGAFSTGVIVGNDSTVTNGGTVFTIGDAASGIQTGNNSTVINTGSGRVFTFGDSLGSVVVGTNSTVQNNGIILTRGNRAIGVVARDGSTVQNNPTGQIATTGTDAHAIVIVGNGTVNNIGGLIQTTGVDAQGIIITGEGTVLNSGTISTANARAIDLALTSTVTNLAGGVIGAANGDAIRVSGAGSVVDNAGRISSNGDGALGIRALRDLTLTNSGLISTTGMSTAAVLGGDGSTVTNTGMITSSGNRGLGVAVRAGSTVDNSGTISTLGVDGGGVVFTADGTLINSGTISTLRTGAQGVTGLGTVNVTNTGTISATSSRGIDILTGNITNGVGAMISGATDAIRVSGNSVITNQGTISGDTGILAPQGMQVVYNFGAINGTGNAASLGGGADSFVSINDGTETGTVDGGADFDLYAFIVTDGTNRSFNLDNIGAQYINFESLRFGSQTFDFVNLTTVGAPTASGIVTLTGTANQDIGIINTGILDGTVNGTVTLFQGANAGIAPIFWLTGNGSIAATGSGVVAIQDGWTINNAGSISSTGGSAISAAGFSTAVNNTGTISNTGMNTAAVVVGANSAITNSGTVSSTAMNGVGLDAGAGSTITNTGTVSTTGDNGGAVIMIGDGTLTNGGSITTTGNGATAVVINGMGNVTNTGIISAADARALDLALAAMVTNETGASITSGTSDGIRFNADGSVLINRGAISGVTGVQGSTGADSVANFGSITGTTSGVSLGLGADIFEQWMGATIAGGINLGGGDDTFVLAGALSSITGALDGGADTDTAIIGGTLDTDNLVNFESIVLGRFFDVNVVGNRNLDGDLFVEGNVSFDLGVDSITNNGNLTLEAGSVITINTPLDFALVGQTVGVIVDNGTFTDNGGTINIIDDDLLIDYVPIVGSVLVQVNAVNPMFGNPDPNLNAFGNAVVGGLGAGTLSAANFAALNGLSAQQFQTAAQDALPGISDGLGREIFETASFSGQALDRHLASEGSAIWGQFGIRGAQQDALSASADGYDSDQLIFTIGADVLASNGIRLGVAASYADIDNQDLRGDTVPTETTQAESIKLGVYTGISLGDRGFLNGELAYITGEADTARGGFFGTTTSNFGFDGFIGRATLGYDVLPDENVSLTPSVGVNFARINFDDAAETGGFGFLVERGDAEFAELRGGLEAGAKMSKAVSGFISGTIIRDLEGSTRSFRLSSTQLPTFNAVLPLRDQDRFELAAGVSINASETIAIDLGYLGDFNDGYQGHSARVTARIGF